MIPRSWLAFCACCCALPAAALLIRPDRDDAEYLELASRYASSIPLGARAGEGVLIAPRWVLTTGSVASALQSSKTPALRIAGRDYRITSVHVHPQWRIDADLGLVFLQQPVAGIEATPIHRGGGEEGATLVIVAHGPSGPIGQPARVADGRKRAAINTVDRVGGRAFSLRIKPADDASDLQGSIVPGEAGSGAYLERDGRLFVAGIALGVADTNRDGVAGNVGDENVYARVSALEDWIDRTMFGVAAEEAASATSTAPRRR